MVQTGMQFLQKGSKMASKSSVALRAKTVPVSLMQKSQQHATVFSLLTSALKSKSVDFSKISAEKKETEEKLAGLAASIEEMSATVATLKSEIETLTAEKKETED